MKSDSCPNDTSPIIRLNSTCKHTSNTLDSLVSLSNRIIMFNSIQSTRTQTKELQVCEMKKKVPLLSDRFAMNILHLAIAGVGF